MKFMSFALMFFLSVPAHAQVGAGVRGGGEISGVVMAPWKIQRGEILEKFILEVKSGLESYLRALRLTASSVELSNDAHRDLLALIDRGLIEDVQRTPYEAQSFCSDDSGQEKAMSTQKGVLGAPICISLPRVLQQLLENPSAQIEGEFRSEMSRVVSGLLVHEHARHFGLEDTGILGNHPIATFVATSFLSASSYYGYARSGCTDVPFEGARGCSLNQAGIYRRYSKPAFKPGVYQVQLKSNENTSRACLGAKFTLSSTYSGGGSRSIDEVLLRLGEVQTFTIYSVKLNAVMSFIDYFRVSSNKKNCSIDVLVGNGSQWMVISNENFTTPQLKQDSSYVSFYTDLGFEPPIGR
jgi:hypothetical protein